MDEAVMMRCARGKSGECFFFFFFPPFISFFAGWWWSGLLRLVSSFGLLLV